MIKKYKKEIIIFISAFTLYFLLGLIFTYYLNTFNYWGVVFDLDTPRIYGDLSLIEYNHYRAQVHPLFIILFQPIVLFIKFIIKDAPLAIIILQSILGAMSLVMLHTILRKIGIKKKLNIVLTVIFGLSFSQMVFTANIETYIFAQVLLIALWLFSLFKMDKELKYWDYVLLVIFGITSLAVTLTNFFQFLIALFFLVFLNKKVQKRFFTCCFIVFISLAISVMLANVQQIIWPSAPNFFTQNILDFFRGTSEEKLYITKDFSFNQILNLANGSFGHSFNLFKLAEPVTGGYQSFDNTTLTNLISMFLFISFICLNIFYIYKTKFNINKHKFYYGILGVYLFNSGLHFFYGNPSTFLYTCHFNFSIIIIIAYILNYFKIDDIKNNLTVYLIIITTILLAFYNNISLFINLSTKFKHIDNIRVLPLLIIVFMLSLICIIVFKNIKMKISSIALIALICVCSWTYINKDINVCEGNCTEFEYYKENFNNYDNQLKEMKNRFQIRPFVATKDEIGIFYFGMVDRRKMVYKDGKLFDLKTNELIKEVNYKKELIVPNEYTVILEDDNKNIYKFVENEKGVFFYENNKEEVISQGNKNINLPEFENNEFSEILKVLHQEILFNIDGDTPRPNLICYEDTEWYRDTMLGAMVLEKTDNINLLEEWVRHIDKIYDNSRSSDINEVDNLGELLYIIGAVGIEREDLISQIKDEINKIKNSDDTISGMVDGWVQKYYPTVLALYGAKKNNIDIDLKVPEYDDGYANLTWYNKNNVKINNTNESDLYPYLDWAAYHYQNYGALYILDEIYPLTYEASSTTAGKECNFSKFYCERQVCLSHMWHASEMFLYLEEIG